MGMDIMKAKIRKIKPLVKPKLTLQGIIYYFLFGISVCVYCIMQLLGVVTFIGIIVGIVWIFKGTPFQVPLQQYTSFLIEQESPSFFSMFSKTGIISDLLIQYQFEVNQELDFYAGVSNGLLVVGAYFKSILVKSAVAGLLKGNVLLGIIVFVIMLFVNLFVGLVSTIIFVVKLIWIEASIEYYLGFFSVPIAYAVLFVVIAFLAFIMELVKPKAIKEYEKALELQEKK